jgi:hypothetical protein
VYVTGTAADCSVSALSLEVGTVLEELVLESREDKIHGGVLRLRGAKKERRAAEDEERATGSSAEDRKAPMIRMLDMEKRNTAYRMSGKKTRRRRAESDSRVWRMLFAVLYIIMHPQYM